MSTHLLNLILVQFIYHTLSASFYFRDHFRKYNDISFPLSLRREAASEIKSMFNFGFDNYMKYAFPHDELKPQSGFYTDSLPELGNAKNTNKNYGGLSLTLIDSLDSLLLFNRTDDFIAAHEYLSSGIKNSKKNNDSSKHIFPGFDIDIRVHVFETNIRILGGLLSAHSLCTHPKWKKLFFSSHPSFKYEDEFLILAQDLGDRLLHAFNTSNSIPFAWINLKHGVISGETRDTCTAGVGTLMLEMSLLSYFTRNSEYFVVAHKALLKLWRLRNVNNNLLGNSLNGKTLRWLNSNGGIGAGIDSFYEYLLKSYIYLGYEYYWDIFQISYKSINKYLRKGSWYIETNIRTSKPSHFHFNSLQSFWPSIQILIGDIPLSLSTINSFFSIWYAYHGLPERFLLNSNQPHSSENQYPLRPELIESIFYAFQSKQYQNEDYYLWLGFEILNDIQNRSKTKYGYTILNNVVSGAKGDYMPSYFLAETVKYLLLLFDDENILHSMESEYIFTTEGHIFPVYNDLRAYIESVIYTNQDIVDLEDNTFIPYTRYHDDDDDDDNNEDDINDIDIKKDKKKSNQTAKKSKKNKKKKKEEYIKSDLDIIDSVNIESIFIFQDGYRAICPASPFDVYSLMHNNNDNERYYDIKSENVAVEEGMTHHWDWIHKMFGKRNEIYHNKKQISTVITNADNGMIQIGDQCPLPSEDAISTNEARRKKKESKRKRRETKEEEEKTWQLSQNNRIRISHDIGHFTVNFVDHTEKLEIFNLGTNWIEMTNIVPIHSKYSQFYPYVDEIALNPEHKQLNDVSVSYLFESVGPTKYELRLKSTSLIACYQKTIINILNNDNLQQDAYIALPQIPYIAISLSSAYFRHIPHEINVDELKTTCELERVLASGALFAALSPSNGCKFPDNLAQILEKEENENGFIVLIDRGECTFYNKVNVLSYAAINGVIIGNVVKHANGNIFTMGSDAKLQEKQADDLSAFMMNKLSYDALVECSSQNNNDNSQNDAEIVEVFTRCEEESVSKLDSHGINSHFAISTKSNAAFVVQQDKDIFRLSVP